MGQMGDWWNPYGTYEHEKPWSTCFPKDEPSKTLWQRVVGEVFSNRPTYVIVDRNNYYFCGYRTRWGTDWNGEYYPVCREEKWSPDYQDATVYETLRGAWRRLRRLNQWEHAAIAAAIREKEEQIVGCEEWLEHTSPTAAISTGASTATRTAPSF
jgi:hypothetical protein